jgi:hypothetical protein
MDGPAKIAATTRRPIRISLHLFCPIDPAKWLIERVLPSGNRQCRP